MPGARGGEGDFKWRTGAGGILAGFQQRVCVCVEAHTLLDISACVFQREWQLKSRGKS